jgi:hypothetical protein
LVISLNPLGYGEALKDLGAASNTVEQYTTSLQLKFAKPFTPVNWPAVAAAYDLRYLQKWYGSTIEQLRGAAISAGFTYTVTSTFKP